MDDRKRIHGTCVARYGGGVLLLGESGAGKSDLALRLLDHGFILVADDQVEIDGHRASAPPALAGLLEVRGLGIVRLPFLSDIDLKLAVLLTHHSDRMPHPERHPTLDLPLIRLARADSASAPSWVALALDCATGRVSQQAGAFAA